MATALSSHSPVEMSRSVTPAARLATEPFRLFDVVRRLFYWLAAGSFGLALIGACAIAFSNVASRRLEIAVRAALGAGPVAIARCLVGDQIVMAFVTLGVTAVSFVWLRTLMARFMGALLLGWRPGEGTPGMWLAGGVAALLAFGILLSLFVAHRASRLDPAQLLREPM
jgi:ABC-type antimicrobial peptide transport system permease subunit